MVSEVDAQDCITIRPMIVHLLNPRTCKRCCCAARVAEQGSAATPEGTP